MKEELDVVAALIKQDGSFLLCQRKKDDGYGNLWEFPGGAVEKGESLPQAIEREIEEELGVTIKAAKFTGTCLSAKSGRSYCQIFIFSYNLSGEGSEKFIAPLSGLVNDKCWPAVKESQ